MLGSNPFGLRRIVVLCGVVAVLAGCASTDAAGKKQTGGSKAATAVPGNYRQLVARHIAANTSTKLVKAEISQPGEVWMGLIQGGNRPIVCANLTIQGPVIQQSYTLGFTFESGRIADVFYPGGYNPAIGAVGAAVQQGLTYGQLSYGPFPEVLRSRPR